jgi:hypothetical protein
VVTASQLQLASASNESSGGAPFLHDMLAQQESWEINSREVKFEQMEDEFGDMCRMLLGEGVFGEVFRG